MTRGAARRSRSRLPRIDRKSTRLNSSHLVISYAVFCLKKKNNNSVAVRKPWKDLCHQPPPSLLVCTACAAETLPGRTSTWRAVVVCYSTFFFFNDTATTEIYTLSLHDSLPI